MSNPSRGNGDGKPGGQGPPKGRPPERPVANRPVHEERLGRVKAAVWLAETDQGVRYSVTVCRIYKDGQGRWQASESFGRDDLLLLAKVVDRVHSWIADATQGDQPF